MDRLGADLRSQLAAVVREATHPHSQPYGRALAIEEVLHAIEAELADARYSNAERKSFQALLLEAMNHGRRMVPR
ncbi:hypothetical protein [Nocardia pseudovaccinii]|uniref:hypothetical protein n=1 Tax=Nocardia pseudovaccinii TaxID=189540 RepID=UPI0012F4A931|nr:hypothetical protein [Nocardia pseudovaccinii]